MPSLNQVHKDHHVVLHPPLVDLSTMNRVPESHAWPTLDDYIDELTSGGQNWSVPLIDLSGSKFDVMNQVLRACEVWGAFQVVNHGVPSGLLTQLQSLGHRLFSLPMEQKLKTLRKANALSGYGLPRISSFFNKYMWYEGFTIAGPPLEHARCLMPNDYNQFCTIVEQYEQEMKHLARTLMELILSSLGLTEEDVKWVNKGSGSTFGVLQLNSYPRCPQPNRAMGLAAHTDSSMLTLLYQTTSQGLQIMSKAGLWVTVPLVPGAMIINIGDLLQILSNSRFSSPLHRVLVSRAHHRLSFAYFWGPKPESYICPHPSLLSQDKPPLYRGVRWQDYLQLKAKLYNKALFSLML